MNEDIQIVEAGVDDAKTVGRLVHALLVELDPEHGEAIDADRLCRTAETLLADDTGVWAFIARTQGGQPVGVLMLNECAAIYAGGRFGEISELYVAPSERSTGAGAMLIDAASSFAKSRAWTRIEVGAPDVPRWRRTVDFYLGFGFTEVGPRLSLKL